MEDTMTSPTQTLTGFLLARIAEDEAAARWADGMAVYAESHEWVVAGRVNGKGSTQVRTPANRHGSTYSIARTNECNAAHIARHDPARVLAECEAKRLILAAAERVYADPGWIQTAGDDILAALALPYADHPDYPSEWRP